MPTLLIGVGLGVGLVLVLIASGFGILRFVKPEIPVHQTADSGEATKADGTKQTNDSEAPGGADSGEPTKAHGAKQANGSEAPGGGDSPAPRPKELEDFPVPVLAGEKDPVLSQGQLALKEKDYNKALDCFDLVLKNHPKTPSAHYLRAHVEFIKANEGHPARMFFNPLTQSPVQKEYGRRALDDINDAIRFSGKQEHREYYELKAQILLSFFNERDVDLKEARDSYLHAIRTYGTVDKEDLSSKAVAKLYFRCGAISATRTTFADQLADLKQAVEYDVSSLDYADALAWLLATCTEDKVRNGQEALRLASTCRKQNPENDSYADTLAAGYAETKQYEEAIRTQAEALALSKLTWLDHNNIAIINAIDLAQQAERDRRATDRARMGKNTPRENVNQIRENVKASRPFSEMKKNVSQAQASKGKIGPIARLKMYESVVDQLPLNKDGPNPVKVKMEAEIPKKYKARLELYMKSVPYREVYSSREDLWNSIFWGVLKSR
jgi:tetratricopeptide (TPR) repeat protein